MNNNVVLSVSRAQRRYAAYVEQNPFKTVPALFTFDRSLPVSENLALLAEAALDPAATMMTFNAFEPIFLDVVSRWVNRPSTHGVVHGSLVLQAVAKIASSSTDVLTLLEYFLKQTNVLTDLQLHLEKVTAGEAEAILLAFYRIFRLDAHRFRAFVLPDVLYAVIKSERLELRAAKFLAVELLADYLSASEISRTTMVHTHVGPEPLNAMYEGDMVDLRFLTLLEAKRLTNGVTLDESPEGTVIVIEPTALSPLVTSVCGILVPNLNHGELAGLSMVPTAKAVTALRSLAHNVQNNRPVMLVGKAGSGKTFLIDELSKYMSCSSTVVKIHLGEQTDAKLLLGTYTSGEKPGTFEWRSGVLTTAVREGRWVVIEDIDKAPTEVLSVLLTLLEKRELVIPSRGEVVKAANGFQLLSTIRLADDARRAVVPDLIGLRLWLQIALEQPDEADTYAILTTRFPLLQLMARLFIAAFAKVREIYQLPTFVALNRGAHPRGVSVRDLMKFCSRAHALLINAGVERHDSLMDSSVYDNIFAEAVDCFLASLAEPTAASLVVNAVGEALEIPSARVSLFLSKHVPVFDDGPDALTIGRARLVKSTGLVTRTRSENVTSFARTNHAVRLMEQIGVSVAMVEPVLLVGETGTGKTTIVQQMARAMHKNLTVINVSQQTETGDLLGGYKPVTAKTAAAPVQDDFEALFAATFSRKRNEKFALVLSRCFNKLQWKNVVRLWREAIKMADGVLEDSTAKRHKGDSDLRGRWSRFGTRVLQFERQAASMDKAFVFDFVEGALIKAVREGHWLLLDEINLASPDTLESLADLLGEQRSVLLLEKGDVESVHAHPDFRLFGCMNPSTDVGKKDLPPGLRSRFSEVYVHSPDRDLGDLLAIIDQYVARHAVGDEWLGNDVAQLYLDAKAMSADNRIVDGANQKPHFSIRTLTRTLVYVRDIAGIYGLRRALYEGFCMAFLTLLDAPSAELLHPVITKYTVGRLKNAKSVVAQCPPPPSGDYVQFRHYWMKRGPLEPQEQPDYIITPFVEKNMLNLVRATAGRRFPVLVQGPTSSGKTSMVRHLARITGHKFVRINNHEHTDLQEYLGTYVSDDTGRLVFKEGVLVEALRKGYWIVLDELNLAPTDVLEALNRLLDDNRELFIPETQEVVHPHPDFMLFATQNPPGLYGGRKVLSRAFRNRFLELHFDDIPQDELETILRERCKIAPSYGRAIVEVYRQLSVQRQSSRLFEKKNSFATLRDLFRWAMRPAVGYEQLAANGYMLLAERVRAGDEKRVVQSALEAVMKVKLDMDSYYASLENAELMALPSLVVWTKAMRRLAVLVEQSLRNDEPVLLVGETGCGKTTVCQLIAQWCGKELITINAHQNTETGDILGAQRPVRNRNEAQAELRALLERAGVAGDEELEVLLERYDQQVKAQAAVSILEPAAQVAETESLENSVAAETNATTAEASSLASLIQTARGALNVLFEWNDGPLVCALKEGNHFLLDEISLADDSVLERLNSVLEPERSLLLAEKGADDSAVTAAAGFEFLATMNPGGDYGKKELSPALRNRFTEIWVPSMDDFDDVRQIVTAKLEPRFEHLTAALVGFSEWFGSAYGGATTGVISLRDILAWVSFVNAANVAPEQALLHGAAMVFIDALGTNNTAFLAENEVTLRGHKETAVKRLSELAGVDLVEFYAARPEVVLGPAETGSGVSVTCGAFTLPANAGAATTSVKASASAAFNLSAPTTAANTMRVLRALQVRKPILLEGSPGVGKTSLVSALASASGNPLTRINLSEQTDLVDLFGSDAPADGGRAGEFSWRDAPFLRAMTRGEWVLLDEMNLASQSVLEGLNACLDHRGEAFIPELNKTFTRHPNFLVFAAQNPQYQGGGRKGLPKSFVNRFSVVYMDVLAPEDLSMISRHLFPDIDEALCDKIISFMAELEKDLATRQWGVQGSPWEFNLRDTLRWLGLVSAPGVCDNVAGDFLNMVISQRFRTAEDRARAIALFERIVGPLPKRDNYFSIGPDFVQAGREVIPRTEPVAPTASGLVPLQCNFKLMETVFMCINRAWPLILVGPTDSGKTSLIRLSASLVGANVVEFSMNSDVDSMDILGGYEQVDLSRSVASLCGVASRVIREIAVVNMKGSPDANIMAHALRLLDAVQGFVPVTGFGAVSQGIQALAKLADDAELTALAAACIALDTQLAATQSVRFAWFDGLLVTAVERGDWLVLDNANLCAPSVLDRLNSLLEPNGTLVINECATADGSPRTVSPHPNFRLFLTMDLRFGELSRAMRNRGIEVFMDGLDVRATRFDRKVLCRSSEAIEEVAEENAENVTPDALAATTEENAACSLGAPVLAHVSAQDSVTRTFALLVDTFEGATTTSFTDEDPLMTSDILTTNDALLGVLTSTVPFTALARLAAFRDVVRASSEFNEAHKTMAEEVCVRAEFLVQTGVASRLREQREQPRYGASLVGSQPLHPLVNSAIDAGACVTVTESVTDTEAAVGVAAAVDGGAVQLCSALFTVFSTDRTVRAIAARSLTGKVNELSYIERSAAAHQGRQIKKAPRLQIYTFVENVAKYLNASVVTAAGAGDNTEAYAALCQLQTLWSCLVAAAAVQDEARLRVYQTLISQWRDEHRADRTIARFIGDLDASLTAFGSDLVLSTGTSMAVLWEAFRVEYPNSDTAWAQRDAVKKLAEQFDSVAAEQHSDATSAVNGLRRLVILLLEDTVRGVPAVEFEQLAADVAAGIAQLEEVASGHSVPRVRKFETEFRMLANLVETEGCVASDSLALEAGRATIAMARAGSLVPYPAVLDSYWEFRDGHHTSFVSGLVTDDLFVSLGDKCARAPSTPGRDIPQFLRDMEAVAALVVTDSPAVLGDTHVTLAKGLRDWFMRIVRAHTEDLAVIEACEAISHATELAQLEQRVQTAVDSAADVIFAAPVEPFLAALCDFFAPALLLAASPETKALGKAFVLFACGSIQLYVPSSEYDPAITDHVLHEVCTRQQQEVAALRQSWAAVRETVSGSALLLESHLETASPLPAKPKVFRAAAMGAVFEEWKSFMDSAMAAEPVKKLLTALEGEAALQAQMFQHNASQFLVRLEQSHSRFSDVNDVLRGYVFGLKLGYDLLVTGGQQHSLPARSWVLDIPQLVTPSRLAQHFVALTGYIKAAPLDSLETEHLLAFFMKQYFAIEASSPGALDGMLGLILQTAYYRWSLRRMKEQQEEVDSGSLYKYADPSHEAEDDFIQMFPDYEEVMDAGTVDAATATAAAHANARAVAQAATQDAYHALCRVYMSAWNPTPVRLLVGSGSEVFKALGSDCAPGSLTPAVLSSLVLQIKDTKRVFSTTETVDFYQGTLPSETRRAGAVMERIGRRVGELLEQWPEHATLQLILAASGEFLAFPAATTMARLIQKIEQIYTYIAEWEKYAHSGISLKVQFDELTKVIVSWRQLELASWNTLFEQEDAKVEKTLGRWWFHLFETIVVPLMNDDEVEAEAEAEMEAEAQAEDGAETIVPSGANSSTEGNIGDDSTSSKILSALNIFLADTTYGEFPHRLALVRAFAAHTRQLRPAGSPVNSSLLNLIAFYEQFESVIANHVLQKRKVLEKEMKDVILLASWKDVNVDALKQSARKSHASLYKLVRKYRTALAGSVKAVIETGLPTGAVNGHGAEITLPHHPDVDLTAVVSVCEELPTWSERAKRLRDITLVEKNMGVYVGGIASEILPDLLSYARELQSGMDELRKKTPKEATEENKKEVSALKTQKRMLLAGTLRELRAMGIRTHLKAEIVAGQGSVAVVLARAAAFTGTLLEGSDGNFFRVLDLMPRLRAAAAAPSEDVPPADVARGVSAFENLLATLIAQRQPMSALAVHAKTLAEAVETLETIGDTVLAPAVVPVSRARAVVNSTAAIRYLSAWMPALLDIAVETAGAAAQMASVRVSTDVFTNAKVTLMGLCRAVSQDLKVGTDVQAAAIEAVEAFLTQFKTDLEAWKQANPSVAFVADTVLGWLVMQTPRAEDALEACADVSDVERALRSLSTAVLLSVQRVAGEQRSAEITLEDKWMALSQQRLMKYVSLLYPKTIGSRIATCLETIRGIEHDSHSARLTSNLVAFTLPLIRRYQELVLTVLQRVRTNYVTTSRAVYMMATALHTLSADGFCQPEPPSTTKENDNLQDGTGLGDGEGATNTLNDVEDDEDLTEDAQQPNEEKGDEEDENDDAVDIEGDMAGNLEDASDQGEDEEGDEGEELDEEVDDLDESDPNAVDEKMWDEEAQDDKKEKESDEIKESGGTDENQGEDDQDEKDNAGDQKDDPQAADDAEKEKEDEEKQEDEDAEDEEDVGQQEDEVKNDEGEQLDDNVPETETLDLPEDLNLDGDDDKEPEGDDDDGEEMADAMDEDMDEEADGDEALDGEPEGEGQPDEEEGDEAEGETENGEAEAEDTPDAEMEDAEEGDAEQTEEGEGAEEEEDELVGDKKEEEKETQGETTEGLDGDEAADAEDVDMEAAVKQNDGSTGDGDDNQVVEEQDAVGASGAANPQEAADDQETTTNEDTPDAAQESLKQLGDSLKEFHRRRQEIKEAAERDETAEENAAERPDAFEHTTGENSVNETQAMGAADKEQIQSVDEEMAIDDEDETEAPAEVPVEEKTGETEAETEAVQEALEEQGEANGVSQGAFMGVPQAATEDGHTAVEEVEDVDMEPEQAGVMVSEGTRTMDEARALWREADLATLELTAGLCEQLRLILEPTLATKLRGDYKTGKRLNMKRIIPYIASEFRKDKIWLRRTKPSKRQYQIMVAVDDSKSMAESKAVELAFQSIALVSKALTQLESGGLSIVKFGEDTQVVHQFDQPFTSETGARVFQCFDFQQTRTDVQRLVRTSLGLFEGARATGDADLWQLQVIISDGVCEDHATIQRLVRRAREDKIMLVFVVINGTGKNESILDMSQVSYIPDAAGNMVLKVDKYLDSFPFEFYVVVHDINELPEMLALILRQYFTELASA